MKFIAMLSLFILFNMTQINSARAIDLNKLFMDLKPSNSEGLHYSFEFKDLKTH